MSAVCARNGGAVLFLALTSELARGHLFAMQRDMDEIASGRPTDHRVHRAQINDAWAAHAQTLKARGEARASRVRVLHPMHVRGRGG
jgi:hypothetical protein